MNIEHLCSNLTHRAHCTHPVLARTYMRDNNPFQKHGLECGTPLRQRQIAL